MSGYQLVSKTVTGVFSIAAFVVWVVKNRNGIATQISDTQPEELIGVATAAFTVDVPKVWAAFMAEPEQAFVE